MKAQQPDRSSRQRILAEKSEKQFFQGPQSRWEEFVFSFRVMTEFIRGFRAFHFLGPCVTFFGSARFGAEDAAYDTTRKMAAEVAILGFTVMTGGGGGIMEAANRGARESGGRSVGCNIVLPEEQAPNAYLDKWINIRYFLVRKFLLIKYSFAFVVMPGGFGTMDEFFEALTLTQTGKISEFPIIVFDKVFHTQLMKHIDNMVLRGTIAAIDRDLIFLTDSVSDAISYIKERSIARYGLKAMPRPRPLRWLLERE